MFSATFPRQMEALARRILNRPIEVQVGGRSVVCKDIEQAVSIVEEEGKFLKLLEVLGSLIGDGLAIIFVDKQEHADSLLKDLMNAKYENTGSLHGGIDQYDRDRYLFNLLVVIKKTFVNLVLHIFPFYFNLNVPPHSYHFFDGCF